MPVYSVADGWNVALVSLVALDPQPEGMPVMPVVRNYAVSGTVHEQGGFVDLKYSALDSEADYLAVLTQFGLHNADTNEITIYCRNGRLVWTRYNGLAVYPEAGQDMRWQQFYPREIVIRVKHLVALA